MHPAFFSRKALALVAVLWSIVTAMAVLAAFVSYRLVEGQGVASVQLFATLVSTMVPWFGLLLFVCLSNFYLCQRWGLAQTPLALIIMLNSLYGFVAVALWLWVGKGWAGLLAYVGMEVSPLAFKRSFWSNAVLGGLAYSFWVVTHYFYLLALARDDVNNEELAGRLMVSEVELQAIKATIHPHFLYNSLNLLSNLSLTAPEKIHDLCVQLAEFLRYSVNYGKQLQVTIADEVEHIDNYLSIERARFGDRLSYTRAVAHEVSDAAVFPLLLFPLVENAIKHGIASSNEPGFIDLRIGIHDDWIVIVVCNSRDTLLPTAVLGTGHGLAALQKRLQRFYPHRGQLIVEETHTTFTVTVKLPREASR